MENQLFKISEEKKKICFNKTNSKKHFTVEIA